MNGLTAWFVIMLQDSAKWEDLINANPATSKVTLIAACLLITFNRIGHSTVKRQPWRYSLHINNPDLHEIRIIPSPHLELSCMGIFIHKRPVNWVEQNQHFGSWLNGRSISADILHFCGNLWRSSIHREIRSLTTGWTLSYKEDGDNDDDNPP